MFPVSWQHRGNLAVDRVLNTRPGWCVGDKGQELTSGWQTGTSRSLLISSYRNGTVRSTCTVISLFGYPD